MISIKLAGAVLPAAYRRNHSFKTSAVEKIVSVIKKKNHEMIVFQEFILKKKNLD
jgi:cystathionine beta-lyase family protein involved in aluminum resistance